MIQKTIIPVGWPCALEFARPGPFVTLDYPDLLCFKSDYHHNDGRVIAYNSAGEFFCGRGNDEMVQPVDMVTEDED